MTEHDFEGCWTIRSSTSRFFPAHSKFHLKRQQPPVDEFEVEVDWETYVKVKLDGTFREAGSGKALEGIFGHPKGGPKDQQEDFEIVLTLCPVAGPKQERYLFGRLRKPGREDEPIGVWVADAPPPPPTDPRSERT